MIRKMNKLFSGYFRNMLQKPNLESRVFFFNNHVLSNLSYGSYATCLFFSEICKLAAVYNRFLRSVVKIGSELAKPVGLAEDSPTSQPVDGR